MQRQVPHTHGPTAADGSESADIVVLGAGPAGLAAAWRAALAGHSVVVLERGPVVGGLASSFEVAGVRVDHGSHRLHPTIEPRVLASLRALLGDDLQVRPRNGRILLQGRAVAFPLKAADAARRLPRTLVARAARDAVTRPLRSAEEDTYASRLRASLGPALCDAFWFPYARKVWGLEPDEISAEQARRRVSAGSPLQIAQRLLRRRSTFLYPRRGFGQIAERLADAAHDAGADVRLGAEVRELAPENVVRLADGSTVGASRVWSTIPITLLARLSPGAPPVVREAASSLHTRAMVLVYLVLGAHRYTPHDAHYLPEAWTPVTRVSEPKNYRAGDDPSDVTILCAEIPCAVGDATWTTGEDALTSLVVDTLVRAGLPRPRPVGTVVRRVPSAYPVYRVGYETAFEAVDQWASAQPGLLTFGRQGLFAHDNTHHALAMAWAAADALRPGAEFDEDRWRASRRGFARHVVED